MALNRKQQAALQTLFSQKASKMAKLSAALVLVVALWQAFAPSSAAQADVIVGQVVGVADGDTVTVLDGTEKYRVRLAFIDAPEKKQAYGQRAKQALSDAVYQKRVEVQVVDRDRYGRVVGKLHLNGMDVNYQMVQYGFAWHYTAYAKNQPAAEFERYSAGQHEAQLKRLGLWDEATKPTPPWEFRRQQRNDTQR